MQRKGTHMLEKQNYEWPWAKETPIPKGEKSLFLFGSHLTHTLPVVRERDVRKQEENSDPTQKIYHMAV